MNQPAASLLFPQLVMRNHGAQKGPPRLRGILLPTEPGSLAAFYRALPCLGAMVRETCERHPDASVDKMLRFALATLRENAALLEKLAPVELENTFSRALQDRLLNVFSNSHPANAKEPATPALPFAPASAPRHRVLVAGRDPIARFLVCSDLRSRGLEPHTADDAAEILLLAGLLRPAQVLLNSSLDGLDSDQVQEILRGSKFSGNPAVTFLNRANASSVEKTSTPFIPASAGTLEKTPPVNLPVSASTMKHIGLHTNPADLARLLQLVAWIVAPAAKQRGVRIEVAAPDAGLIAACDGVRMQAAFENLLSHLVNNAADGATVRVTARGENARLVFSAQADRPLSLPTSRWVNECPAGAELSLETCRDIVEAHGGNFAVDESSLCVRIQLPAVETRPMIFPGQVLKQSRFPKAS